MKVNIYMPVEFIFFLTSLIVTAQIGISHWQTNLSLLGISILLGIWMFLAHNYRDPTVLRQEKRVEHIQNLSYINFDGKQILLSEEQKHFDVIEVTWTKPCTVFGIAFHQGEYNFKGIE